MSCDLRPSICAVTGRVAVGCAVVATLAAPGLAAAARRTSVAPRHPSSALAGPLPADAGIPDVPASPVSASRGLETLPAPDSRPSVFGTDDGGVCLAPFGGPCYPHRARASAPPRCR